MDKRFWLAIANAAFGGGLLLPLISEMINNGGNIVVKARPVAENYSAAETLMIFAIVGLYIINAIMWTLEDNR